MTEELRTRIRDFIVGWDHTVNDLKSVDDFDFWLRAAIDLLEEAVGESGSEVESD